MKVRSGDRQCLEGITSRSRAGRGRHRGPGGTVDWLPGVLAAHPASPADAQHTRTAARKVLPPPRNPGHLPIIAEPRR